MYFLDVLNSIDFSILDFIQNTVKCVFLDYIMAFFSYVGNGGVLWIATAVVMLFFRKTRSVGVMALCALLAGYLIGEIGIKNIVCRPRPFVVNPDITLNILPPNGFSFPSGHSCSSFAAATVIFSKNRRLGVIAMAVAALIAFSRLYNYVHFPSDVLCGIILGIVCALVTVVIFKKTGLDARLSGDLKKKVADNE